jgi:hypothetical protein
MKSFINTLTRKNLTPLTKQLNMRPRTTIINTPSSKKSVQGGVLETEKDA